MPVRSRHGYDYDVAILSDLRYPGGNSSSIVEEVKAQAAAGFSTALVHVPAAHMKRHRSFNHKIIHCLSAGLARLEPTDRRLRVRALVVRQPRLFADPLLQTPQIDADERVFVLNHPPFDGRFPIDDPYYRIDEVRERAEATFGPMRWAPIGPLVRTAVGETGTDLPMVPDDWHNIVNVDEWRAERGGYHAGPPVIGRHSREHRAKWPTDPEEILAAYPEDGRFAVRVLGGARPVVDVLGREPKGWTILPFGAVHPANFLLDVDYFVYYHHPGWVEAFGRNVIEALASGTPAILPRTFEPLFGDGALYGTPADVRPTVERLHADRDAYEERVEVGRAFASDHFGAGVHVERLAALIGRPGNGRTARPPSPPRRRRVLLVATQSHGFGSVARLLRLARRLPSHLEPTFAVGVPSTRAVSRQGYLCDQLAMDVTDEDGDARLAQRLAGIIERERPEVVVVDGRALPVGVAMAARASETPFVWLTCRYGVPSAEERSGFAEILRIVNVPATDGSDVPRVPGAQDGVVDVGPFGPAVGPVSGEPSGIARVLVALGADARRLDESWLRRVRGAVEAAGFTPIVAGPALGRLADAAEGARQDALTDVVELDPLGADLAEYDLAVVAPGHTIVHDLLSAGIPLLAVTRRDGAQRRRRAEQLEAAGLGPTLVDPGEAELVAALTAMHGREPRAHRARAAAALDLVDGTARVAEVVERLAHRQATPEPAGAALPGNGEPAILESTGAA